MIIPSYPDNDILSHYQEGDCSEMETFSEWCRPQSIPYEWWVNGRCRKAPRVSLQYHGIVNAVVMLLTILKGYISINMSQRSSVDIWDVQEEAQFTCIEGILRFPEVNWRNRV